MGKSRAAPFPRPPTRTARQTTPTSNAGEAAARVARHHLVAADEPWRNLRTRAASHACPRAPCRMVWPTAGDLLQASASIVKNHFACTRTVRETQTMVLREATQDDVPTLIALIHIAFEEYRGRLEPPSGAHQGNSRRHWSLSAAGSCRPGVAQRAGHRLRLLSSGRRACLLRAAICAADIPSAWRGARADHIRRAAGPGPQGWRRTQLGTHIALPHLQAYYERLGYRVVRYEAHEGYDVPTSVVMEKQVL